MANTDADISSIFPSETFNIINLAWSYNSKAICQDRSSIMEIP